MHVLVHYSRVVICIAYGQAVLVPWPSFCVRVSAYGVRSTACAAKSYILSDIFSYIIRIQPNRVLIVCTWKNRNVPILPPKIITVWSTHRMGKSYIFGGKSYNSVADLLYYFLHDPLIPSQIFDLRLPIRARDPIRPIVGLRCLIVTVLVFLAIFAILGAFHI